MRKFEKDYRLRESDDVLSRENAIHLDLDMRLDAVEQVAEAVRDGNREDVDLLIEKIDQTVSPLTQAMQAVIEEQGKGFTPDRIAETADKRFTSEREIGALHTEMQNLTVQAERNKAEIEARVADAIDDLVNGAPGTLDTLKELSAAIGNDKDFGASIAAQLAKKVDTTGGTITGETTFKAIARFQAGMTVKGDVSATGRLIVGESPDGSWITMRDPGQGDRFIHNDGATIGFVGQHGQWVMRVSDDGNIWSRTSGWMSDRFNAKFDKTGGTLTGAIISSAETPIAFKNRTSEDYWHVYSSGGQFGLYWDAKANGVAGNKFAVDYASGAIWCAQFGDLNTRIETRAREYAEDRANAKLDRTGGTMTGDLEIQKANASIMLHYSGVRWWKMMVTGDGRLNFPNNDGAFSFAIGPGGDVWTRQIGDLNTRIETRAREYAEDRANRVTARWVFAGDLPFNHNHQDSPVEHYNGAAITGHAASQGQWLRFRYRYLQMKSAFDQWYTIGYA